MNLLASRAVWQNSAQNHAKQSTGFSADRVWRSIKPMTSVSSKTSVCTSHYRYPSPLKRFGSFWTGPLFSVQSRDRTRQKAAGVQQRTAENRARNYSVIAARQALLKFPLINPMIRGENSCRSNAWSLWPHLLCRSGLVWTMMSSAPLRGLLQAPLSWRLPVAVCSPAPSSGRALVRCATTSAHATNLKYNRTRNRPATTTHETATAGIASRWFFIARLLGNAPAGRL